MARQLAVRTVVEWFGNLSFDQQNDALRQMQDRHEDSRAAKKVELEEQLAALGYGAAKRRGRPKGTKSANGAKRSNGKKGAVKVKYRDSKTGDTWTGRGRMANWLKSKQESGEKIEKYLV